ncbi:LADA_0C00716g1_1 [Lachancea dasiensis]|uniref:Octanoyltransferase n=1 Tax=Lachancea dasiensis TaxID=1072105 RepID=A0A1G4IX77_9SACH|nr:LADA_0C00716g1_1 [Lachancea dasiensis]
MSPRITFKQSRWSIQQCLRASYVNSRSSSSCSGKATTFPVEESSRALRHLEFVKPMNFEKGLKIQEHFVRAQLDMKHLTSKIDRKLRELEVEHPGAVINEHEELILKNILQMKPNPVVLTFEFDPTYTGGKRSKKDVTPEEIAIFESFVPKTQIDNPPPRFVQAERGGQVTFHGPGQVVAYVILDLKSFNAFPAKCLVSAIEDSTISTLRKVPGGQNGTALGLEARKTSETGVWINEEEKIASIGIHVRRSITSHGVCINVNPDLSYMNGFVMCGLQGTKATSVLDQLPQSSCSTHDVAVMFANELARKLGIETVERIQLDDIDID